MKSSYRSFFVLYAHNIAKYGDPISIIYDLKNGKLLKVPSVLISIIKKLEHQSIEEFLLSYNHLDKTLLNKYIDYLIDNDLGFLTKTPNAFPRCKDVLYSASPINGIIVEFDSSKEFIEDLINCVNFFNCKFLEIRIISNEDTLEHVETALVGLNDSVCASIHMTLDAHMFEFNKDLLSFWIDRYRKISRIYITNSSKEAIYEYSNVRLFFISKKEKPQELIRFRIINRNYIYEMLNKKNPALYKIMHLDAKGHIVGFCIDGKNPYCALDNVRKYLSYSHTAANLEVDSDPCFLGSVQMYHV